MRPGRRPSPWLVLACLACACACEEVPTLTFDERDATPDVDDGAARAPDSSTDGGCGGLAPPQAPYVCCGSVVCQGLCNGQCDACASKCSAPGQICCAKNNNVVCFAAGSICK
jgi:hypothetical protein